jgi:hypothetical protein
LFSSAPWFLTLNIFLWVTRYFGELLPFQFES